MFFNTISGAAVSAVEAWRLTVAANRRDISYTGPWRCDGQSSGCTGNCELWHNAQTADTLVVENESHMVFIPTHVDEPDVRTIDYVAGFTFIKPQEYNENEENSYRCFHR